MKYHILLLLFVLCFNHNISAQSIDTQDSLALLALVDNTQGNNPGGWNNSLPPSNQWTGSNPVAQWYGITVAPIGPELKVTEINVAGLSLQGAFPNFIFNGNQLEELVVLDLGSNLLTGGLSEEIFVNLGKLEELRLNDNFLNQPLPAVAGNQYNLSKLRVLDLSNNSIEGNLNLDWILGQQISASISSGYPTIIKSIYVHSNNFENALLTSSSARFDSLSALYVENNRFHFDDLYILANGLKMPQMLGGNHYVPQNAPLVGGNPDTFAFRYSPQADAGIGGVRRRPDGNVIFNSTIGEPTAAGVYNSTDWSRIQGLTSELLGTVEFLGILPLLSNLGLHTATLGSINLAPNNDRSAVLLSNIDASHHDWLYRACASNDSFPLLQICMIPKKLIVGACFDDLGNEIACQQIIVQFEEDATPEEREQLRRDFGISVIDSCMCGSIELWGIPDTLNAIDVEHDGKGTRRSAAQAQSRPNMLGGDPDYELLSISPLSLGDSNPSTPTGSSSSSPTLIAIIDTGVDYDHPNLTRRIWINPDESTTNGLDDDGNCIVDDRWGYNALNNSGIPFDDHGHGSAIAGIVAGKSLPNHIPSAGTLDSLALLPIKFTNRDGKGTLFNAACGIRYAADYHNSTGGQKVRVMNASWGYYGEPSKLLEDAIRHAGETCGLLFVCSAGNDHISIDSANHYPSNYDLENILTVAAVDPIFSTQKLANYSNFGATHTDIAAIGDYTTTGAMPLGLAGLETVYGTSFATAQLSRAAGMLFHQYPDASYRAVKRALMLGVTPLTGADSTALRSRGVLNYPNALALLAADPNRQNCMPSIGLNLYLEGALDTLTGQMTDALYSNGHLPTTQPFNVAPWFYDGNENISISFTGSNTPVDWILVSMCNGNTCVYKAALLLRNGLVVDADGSSLDLPALASNTVTLQIIPNNHLAAISTQEISLTDSYTAINLDGLLTNVKTIGGYQVFPAGDANGDGEVNPVDKNAYWRVGLNQNGYLKGDFNLDGVVDNADYPLWMANQHLESQCVKCRKSVN